MNIFKLLCLTLVSVQLFADPIGIIGGQGPAPYAALLQDDGSLVTVSGLPATGLTFRVGMNASGVGLIGGTEGINAYAAFVSQGGVLTPVSGLMAPGEIYSVAINASGLGIAGGGRFTSNVPYAAIVKQDGTAISVSGLPASGLLYGVAIDKDGDGIIGGIGPANSAYAALTSSQGTSSPIAGLPSTGAIFWVATNQSKMRFIGGQDNASVYAAFVKRAGTLLPISDLPLGQNYSVAINAEGNAIMGGKSLSLPYAALVSENGDVKTIHGLPTTTGIIYNVTLNDAGTGLIAGFSAEGPFGAFVDKNGSLTRLKGLPSGTGFLDGAALHPTGIALVGGTSYGVPFAALAAPNGKLTYLKGLPASGEINSTAFSLLDSLVPKSVGPFESYANTLFVLSNVLTQHRKPCGCASLWVTPFGNYSYTKGAPAYSNKIGGVVLGGDFNDILGGGVAFAENRVDYRHGHANITQESAVLYTSFDRSCFCVNAALWAGLFQTSLARHSLLDITSRAHVHGWNVCPHLEVSAPLGFVDPFIALDWAYNRQSHYREHGGSGFNIRLQNQSLSIFRTEVGCRLRTHYQCLFGQFVFEEKLSYVNRTPTSTAKRRASFVGSASSFDVTTLNSSGQNLGSAEIHVAFTPEVAPNFCSSLDYQGEWGSRFQSHLLTLTLSGNF